MRSGQAAWRSAISSLTLRASVAAGEAGMLCPTVPEAYGGMGLDYRYNAVVAEGPSDPPLLLLTIWMLAIATRSSGPTTAMV